MQRMLCALKDDGVIYTSFKYGTFEGERNGRYFTDFTEKTFDGFKRYKTCKDRRTMADRRCETRSSRNNG